MARLPGVAAELVSRTSLARSTMIPQRPPPVFAGTLCTLCAALHTGDGFCLQNSSPPGLFGNPMWVDLRLPCRGSDSASNSWARTGGKPPLTTLRVIRDSG